MTLEEYYQHYINTKCFVLQVPITYKSTEYEDVSKLFEEYKRAYNYIYVKLNKTQRIELKCDFLDILQIKKECQDFTKYKLLIDGMTTYVQNYESYFKDNKELLSQYYSSIRHKEHFKNLLDRNDEGYEYRKLVEHWVKQRENGLSKNQFLNEENEWIKLSRSFMSSLMKRILFTLRNVIEYKEQSNDLHHSSLRIRLSPQLRMLKQYPSVIRMNYEKDKVYAFQMKEYCLNLFELMYDFLEHNFSVFIKKTPYFDLIQEVYDDINNSIDDEKVRIELELKDIKPIIENRPQKLSSNKGNNKEFYAPKEVKIACFCLDERINQNNYLAKLKDYTKTTSNKILQKPIVRTSQLTGLTENKTADTRHKASLHNAKRLLNGINNKKALSSINQIISTFEDNYREYYE